MSGSLNHSPADIIHKLMVDLSLGGYVGTGGDTSDWQIYKHFHPDQPENSLCVYNTEGMLEGQTHVDLETQEHHGIQVRVQAVDPQTGYTKANAIAIALDHVAGRTVALGANTYLVDQVTRSSPIIALGQSTTNDQWLHTINAKTSITLIT